MATGSYAINLVPFTLMPTTGHWIERSPVGITGDGHEIYGRTHEFQCDWGLSSQSELYQLYNYFLAVGISGTVTVSLPEYGSQTYEFKNYSGCTLSEPSRSDYFQEYTSNMRLLVRNIVV